MGHLDFMSVMGFIALGALAFTILIPLFIAIKHCRNEKREQKLHAQSAGHSLS